MPLYKKQHFLPSSFLKYFSDDQKNCNRKSWVWRFNAKDMRRVPVESQCFADYFYSKENPAETEQMFHNREMAYCRFVDQIRAGKEPSRKDHGDFFLCMFDLHLRNAIHKNRTGEEEIRAYEMRMTMFLSQILIGNPNIFSGDDVKKHIQSNWRMEIIPAPAEYQFIASDHPSVFTTFKYPSSAKGALQLIFLPIDPAHVAVAFDRRFLWLEKKTATPSDVLTLNIGQVQNSEQCLYSAIAPNETELTSFQSVFEKKTPSISEVDNQGWRLPMTYLRPEHHFSFMRLKPLLF